MTLEELKAAVSDVAIALDGAGGPLSPALRARFIAMRAELIGRGIFDPILMRFDTTTVARASLAEVAAQLRAIASGM